MKDVIYKYLTLLKTGILSLVFIVSFTGFAQQDFAKSFVNVFASDEFLGRGYVDNGNEKAAQYLADQFSRFKVKPYAHTYFQKFAINVNTFPKPILFAVGDSALKEGVDFIVDPYSGCSVGVYEPLIINSSNLSKINPNTICVIDASLTKDKDSLALLKKLKYQLSQNNPVVWVTNDKLTWSVAQEHTSQAIFEVKKEAFLFDKQISISCENKLEVNYETQNVIGFVEGRKKKKYIIIGAHYDHLGKMGTAIFNGANDNASGVASLLYLAQHFADHKPKYSLLFVGFGAEEVGLLGSEYYVNHPAIDLKKTKFMLNLDLNGTGEEGVTVVNATIHQKEFKKLTAINEKYHLLEKIKMRGPAANSDHYWFSQKGVPAFFMYTMGGVSHYHDVYDRPETLPLTEFNDLTSLLIQFVNSF